MKTGNIGRTPKPPPEVESVEAARAEGERQKQSSVLHEAKAIRARRFAERKQARVEHLQTAQWPDGKYRVLYADPPWQYSNSGMQDNYGHAERHYPTMPTEEIAALPVADLALDDAVLFLWATAPMLPDALKVMAAWGFEYKTQAVWHKQRHNYGYYVAVEHENLLIGVRGSCPPDIEERPPSVFTAKRSARHSEKPEEFRHLVDRLYPHGPRLELFARSERDGWGAWGNELAGERLTA